MSPVVIVKVQRPMSPDTLDFLVYAEGRKNVAFIHPDKLPKHVHIQLRKDQKGYFFATFEGANKWTIRRRTEEQSW